MTYIVGLVGSDCAGKSTIVEHLKSVGYTALSLSDAVRDEATSQGLDLKVETLTKVGNALRTSEGDDVLAQRTLKKLKNNTPYVIDSIRHSGEVEALMRKPKFVLVSVDAPLYDRWQRWNSRNREGEQKTLEEFAKRDARIFYDGEHGQQMGLCMSMAQHKLLNKGIKTESIMNQAMDKLIDSLRRPTKEEYAMQVAHAVKRRSTCDRLHAGAVIWDLENGKIVSTGYNGSPSGEPHCDDDGHELEEGHCIRTIHAEENAIFHAGNYPLEKCAISVTAMPCYTKCYKKIIHSKFAEIHYDEAYRPDSRVLNHVKEKGINFKQVSIPKTQIFTTWQQK